MRQVIRRDAVGVRRVKAVAREKCVRLVTRQKHAVEHQRTPCGVLRGKLHIVRHDQDGCAFGRQLSEELRQILLSVGVKPFCRLVEQQHICIPQQELADRKPDRS